MLIDRQNAFPPLLNLERVTRLFHLLVSWLSVTPVTPHIQNNHIAPCTLC